MRSTGHQSERHAGLAGEPLRKRSFEPEEAGLLKTAIGIGGHPQLVTGAPAVMGYEMICRLGAGASGEVWLAEELNPERTVAIKILHGNSSADSSTEILRREIGILAKLLHPNLVVLHRGILTTDGRQGLMMEWIDGWPLDEWLKDHPDLTLAKKLELFHGLVQGVAYLHDHGVIHRDLKPANVIVDARGTAKIVDFGLARLHCEEAASSGDGGSIGVSGTLLFMAPEQAANGKGARAMPVDVYALGLLLHRILTGKWHISPAATSAETLAQVRSPPPPDLRSLPEDLRSIVRQALASDPANRYPHARDLEADLSRFTAKQPVAARKHTVIYLATTFVRRQARRSIAAAVLVVTGLGAGGIIYHQHREIAERNDANLKHAYSLTSFTLRQLVSELRTATAENEPGQAPIETALPGEVRGYPALPLDPAGELDLRYYQAMLADLRSANSEGHGRYHNALIAIQPALDLYSELALEDPENPEQLLDAARARLSFARLLDKVGRVDAAGNEARKTLGQVDRLVDWANFTSAHLLPMRCDALHLLAAQAHHSGDFAAAVGLSREMLAACDDLPAGLLVRPENETMPRLAAAAYDLATHAIAAGPTELSDATREIDRAISICRAAYELEPE